ncbi:MAG: type II toxin-antitoxin system HicB family antitoxin [Elainellaceae cyanobacterium]
MKWRIALEPDPETGDWAVWCPELPGCISAGETEDKALENIRKVGGALKFLSYGGKLSSLDVDRDFGFLRKRAADLIQNSN